MIRQLPYEMGKLFQCWKLELKGKLLQHSVEKIFREINSLVTSLVYKNVELTENTVWKSRNSLSPKKYFVKSTN